jgi:uncharacterized membrane protein YhaH (DUF805 family)
VRRNWLKWLFTFEGRVSRKEYLLAGLLLVVLKYGIDWSVVGAAGGQWSFFLYDVPVLDVSHVAALRSPWLDLLLWGIDIPFFWIGIALTQRRLLDARRSPGWVALFFIPILKFALFLGLVLLPSVHEDALSGGGEKLLQGRSRTFVYGVGIASVIGLVLVIFGAHVLMQYAWGLFLGVPFLVGFVASWFFNASRIQAISDVILLCLVSDVAIGVMLISFGFEGMWCLLMALPLAFPFTIAGGLVARSILRGGNSALAPRTFTACVALVPAMMVSEHAAKLEPPVISVTTSVVIDAPVSVVWKNVIAFPPLDPPKELMFRAGIAYPIGAKIEGEGVGAVRRCQFSTGDFVEPITTWDEGRLLAFNVASQPPSLRELSPWDIMPPHIEHNYMRSLHGQFRLVALSDHSTLLEGTTWYQNYFWPQAYWREWSDRIVHRIHMRVLEHVKQQAESQ